jgi:hypothetical protein
VAELWTPNEHDVVLINKSAPFEQLRTSSAASTLPMADSALQLLKNGETNLEELIRMLPYATVYGFRNLQTAESSVA